MARSKRAERTKPSAKPSAKAIWKGSISFGLVNIPVGIYPAEKREELQMAERLVGEMVEKWDPERYRDDYRRDLTSLIERRIAAGELASAPGAAPPPRRPAGGKVLDLMALLKKSVEEKGRGRGGRRASSVKSGSRPRFGPSAAPRAHLSHSRSSPQQKAGEKRGQGRPAMARGTRRKSA